MSCAVRCCCGVDLKTGAFIVAYSNLVVNSILVIWMIVLLILVETEPVYDAQGAALQPLFFTVYLIYLILYIFNIIFNIILLVGLHKNFRKCLNAYMIFTIFFTVINIMEFVLKVFVLYDSSNQYFYFSTFVTLFIIVGGFYSVLFIDVYYTENFDKRPVIPNAV